MAGRLASHDWASTPLGAVESWSPGLRAAVGIMLRTRYPMLLSWGEHLVMLYNDAFIPTLGTKHPHAVGGLLRELPSLPSRQAVLLGWAAPIPVLVEVDELPDAQRPHSADPDFWNVWTLAEERGVDWGAVSKAWSGAAPVQKPEEE